MIEIQITNFQAIDSLTLKIEGFTALVGRSNIGKSSIVRALKCALSGSSGSDFVRHDARTCARLLTGAKSCKCFASVKLTFGEGQAVLWEKGSRINRYTVWKDGVDSVYDRVGQGMNLGEVLEARFAPAELGPIQALLQVSSQFDSPFLLDLSGPAVADLLSDIGQLDDINHALAAVAKDRRNAVSTRKVREGDIEALNQQLAPYTALDAHLHAVTDLQAQGRQLQEVDERFRLADRLISGVTDSAQSIRRLTTALKTALPDVTRVLETSKHLQRATLFVAGWTSRAASVTALTRALEPALPMLAELTQAFRRRAQLINLEAALVERERVHARLGKVGHLSVPSVSELQSKLSRFERLEQWLRKLSELKEAFVKGTKLPRLVPGDPLSLAAIFKRLTVATRLTSSQQLMEADLLKLERALEDCTSQLEGVLGEFAALGLCPTCHQGITPEHVVHV